MRRSINDIVDEINNRIEGSYTNETTHNISVLQPDENGRTFPMTRDDADNGIQISPDDTGGLQFYHRMLDPVEIKPLEGAKGSKSYQLAIYSMRLVGVGYRRNITSDADWNNQEIADDVMRILGQNASLSNKEVLQVQGRVIVDKLTVLNEEFAGHELEVGPRTLELIAFAIDYTIQQRQICDAPEPTGLTQVTAFICNQTTYNALTPNSNFYYLIDNDVP